MPTQLNPYLSFNGDARQAMEYYKNVFGGELTLNTFGDFGDPNAPESDKIMHSQLKADDLVLMGADNPPGSDYKPGNTMSVSLSGEDATKLRGYWEKLSDGGTVSVPLEKQMWGDEFGMCEDKFGVAWMVNIGSPQS